MVKYSRFAHIYNLGDAYALYHSLRMKPVYLTRDSFMSLQKWLASSFNIDCVIPESIKQEVEELKKYKILINKDIEDENVLNYVKSKIPPPAINVCYMILSEQCNLACKYCFLGNNNSAKRSRFIQENMTVETAEKAIKYFVRQIKNSGLDFEENKPAVIFYGGEPLLNFPVLEYIASRINALRSQEVCLKNVELSVVTNGLLLTDERILKLKELGVSIAISVDGFTERENAMRIDINGNPVYQRIIDAIARCRKNEVDISLSVTLGEETIKNKDNILLLIERYGIKSFGFNIMMSDSTFIMPESYSDDAAQFIIDEFIELRKRGVYEDRMMRKLKAFSKAQVYFSDCAATSGGQIVVAPDGKVGICHGCLHDKKYFVSDVTDELFDCTKDSTFIEWSQLTPINHEECLSCPALGICGGGCPINAMNSKVENTIHSIDTRFCVHAKKTLDFLIHDLYRIMLERKNINE